MRCVHVYVCVWQDDLVRRQKETLERSIQSRKEEEEAMEQARLAVHAEEERKKKEQAEEDRKKKEQADQERKKAEQAEEERKEEEGRRVEEQREEERRKAREERRSKADFRRREPIGNEGGKGDMRTDERTSRKRSDQRRAVQDVTEAARSDNVQSNMNLEDSEDGGKQETVKIGSDMSIKRKESARGKKKERRPAKNGSTVKRKERAARGVGMGDGEWKVVTEDREEDGWTDGLELAQVDQAEDDRLSAMLLSAIPSQLPAAPFAHASNPYHPAPFSAYPLPYFSEAPSFPPHFDSATGVWDQRRDAGVGWDMGRGAAGMAYGEGARGEWERYRNAALPRQPPGDYGGAMGRPRSEGGAGGGGGPFGGAGADAPWQDQQRLNKPDFAELGGLEGERGAGASVQPDLKQSLARDSVEREVRVVGRGSVTKGEDAGVGDLKSQVEKVRAETEAAVRQVQSAEAALAQIRQGETVTAVPCCPSIHSHNTNHPPPPCIQSYRIPYISLATSLPSVPTRHSLLSHLLLTPLYSSHSTRRCGSKTTARAGAHNLAREGCPSSRKNEHRRGPSGSPVCTCLRCIRASSCVLVRACFLYAISRAAQCGQKPNVFRCSNLHKCAQTHLAELQRQEAEASARLRAGQPLDPSPQSDRDEGQPAVNQGESRSSVQEDKDSADKSAMQDVLKGILETVQATEERSALLHQRLLDKQLPTDQGLAAAPPTNIAGGDRWTGVPVGNRDAVGISWKEERYYDQRGREDWNSGREGSFEADEALTSQLDSAVPLSESKRAYLRTRPREETDSAYLRTQEGERNQHTLRREEKDRGRRVRQDGNTRDDEAFRRTSYSRYAPYSSPSPPGRYRSSLPSPDPFPSYSFSETQQGDVPRDVPRGRKGRKEKQTRTKIGGKKTVRDVLAAVGLLAFEDMLVRNGWDSVQRIKMLAEDDLV